VYPAQAQLSAAREGFDAIIMSINPKTVRANQTLRQNFPGFKS